MQNCIHKLDIKCYVGLCSADHLVGGALYLDLVQINIDELDSECNDGIYSLQSVVLALP